MYGPRGRQQWRPPADNPHDRESSWDEARRDRRRTEDWVVPKRGYYYEHDDRGRDEDRPKRGGGYPQGGSFPHRRGFRDDQPGREQPPARPRHREDDRRPGWPFKGDRGVQHEDAGEGQYSPTRHSEPADRPPWPSRGNGLERQRDRERSPPPFQRQPRGRGHGSGYGRRYYDEHDHRDSPGGPAWRGRGGSRRGSPGGKWKHDMFEKIAAEGEQPGPLKEQQERGQEQRCEVEEDMPDHDHEQGLDDEEV